MNEQVLRELVSDTLAVMAKYAQLTGTAVDDNVVSMMQKAVANDVVWSWIYQLLSRFLSEDDGLLVGDIPEPVEAAEVGMDPLTIIAIIKAIAELIKLFRK